MKDSEINELKREPQEKKNELVVSYLTSEETTSKEVDIQFYFTVPTESEHIIIIKLTILFGKIN